MPLYEYHCRRCDQTFEIIQKFSDDPLTNHEACGGEVERLVSPPALQFKGSGWYITDYARKNSGGNGSNGKSDSKSDSSKSDSSKSESSKTETKSESKPAATKSTD